MTQIASLLVVATVLLTYGLHFTVREGGGLIREIKLPMQELELKMQGGGGAYVRGGHNRGILQ